MLSGDVLIGLPSSGVHSNGFSLIRTIIHAAGLDYSIAAPFDPTTSLGQALLTPTRIYTKPVLALARAGKLKGAAHITNGGLMQSIPRILPPSLCAQIQAEAWELPAVFRWLGALGKIPSKELASTFNCGMGMALVVAKEDVDEVMRILKDTNEAPVIIGELIDRDLAEDAVNIEAAESCWLMLPELGVSLPFPSILSSLQDPHGISRMRAAVLVGPGSVSPLQALVKASSEPAFPAEVCLVASPHQDSKVLQRCKAEGIMTSVIDASKEELSRQLQEALDEAQADFLVVLDDFETSLLNSEFRSKWHEKALIMHPSLLPAFPGRDAISEALKAGVRVTGCTVHFLPLEEDSCGPIVVQEMTQVLRDDTAAVLQRRVTEECEWVALPQAVQMFASGKAKLQDGALWLEA